jgi:hypothetical protein
LDLNWRELEDEDSECDDWVRRHRHCAS